MGKANHLKPTHTGGTASITTRHKPARELVANLDPNGCGTGETMTSNLEWVPRSIRTVHPLGWMSGKVK
jgi:hypothetical protein